MSLWGDLLGFIENEDPVARLFARRVLEHARRQLSHGVDPTHISAIDFQVVQPRFHSNAAVAFQARLLNLRVVTPAEDSPGDDPGERGLAAAGQTLEDPHAGSVGVAKDRQGVLHVEGRTDLAELLRAVTGLEVALAPSFDSESHDRFYPQTKERGLQWSPLSVLITSCGRSRPMEAPAP